MNDRNVLFHQTWLGLAQPVEGLVFSVPVLAADPPEVDVALTTAFEAPLDTTDPSAPRIKSLATSFRTFLGYDQPAGCWSREATFRV